MNLKRNFFADGLYSLQKFRRQLRRKWGRIMPHDLPAPFFHPADIDSLQAFFAEAQGKPGMDPVGVEQLHGKCFVCDQDVDFVVEQPSDDGLVNWRETLSCPNCGLINRWRSCMHVFEAICQPKRDDRIYLTETLSPVFEELDKRYEGLVGSEYFPDANPGETVSIQGRSVRNEDATALSFSDERFEAVLCFDVLEHVPDYRKSLCEFCRVLTPGGSLVLSVPFSFRQETLVRALVNDSGEIEHIVEPCYHGDPLSPDGVLSFYDFGLELLDEMYRAGFDECFILCYQSRHWGYLHENVAFIARKLKKSSPRR